MNFFLWLVLSLCAIHGHLLPAMFCSLKNSPTIVVVYLNVDDKTWRQWENGRQCGARQMTRLLASVCPYFDGPLSETRQRRAMTSRQFERQRLRADDRVVLRLIEIGQSSAELVKSPSPCDHSLSGSNSVADAAVASLTFDLSSIWGTNNDARARNC